MSECQLLKERLKIENQEMEMMIKREIKHSIEKTEFKRMKAVWEGQTVARLEIPTSAQQFFTWIVPAIKEEKFVRVINTHLRASNRKLRGQVEYLKLQLKQSQDELKRRGTKRQIQSKTKMER